MRDIRRRGGFYNLELMILIVALGCGLAAATTQKTLMSCVAAFFIGAIGGPLALLAAAFLAQFRLTEWVIGLGLAAIFGYVGILFSLQTYYGGRFITEWKARLPAYGTDFDRFPAVDLKAGLPGGAAPDAASGAKLVKFKFPDRSWFIAAERDHHEGGRWEWDETVFLDSRNGFHTTEHHYCGWKGLTGELASAARTAPSADDFFQKLR